MIILIASIAITYCLIRLISSPVKKKSYHRASSLCGILDAQGLINKNILFNKLIIEKMLFLPIILVLFLVTSSNHFIMNLYILVVSSLLIKITKYSLMYSKTSIVR